MPAHPGAAAYVNKEDFGPALVKEIWARSGATGDGAGPDTA